VLYQIKLQCASDANDTAAMIAALCDLVRLTNKTSYWNNLIRLERQGERDDRNLLMIYRVMYDTNSMQADSAEECHRRQKDAGTTADTAEHQSPGAAVVEFVRGHHS
jgi:hypothetical protein